MRVHTIALLILTGLSTRAAVAQSLLVLAPARSSDARWQLESTVSAYTATTFVDRYHRAERFGSDLAITQASVAISRRISDDWRAAVEIPFRSATFGPQHMQSLRSCNLFVEAFRRRASLDGMVRATYSHPSELSQTKFITSDSPTAGLLLALSTRDGLLPRSARAILNWSCVYAKADTQIARYLGSSMSAAISPMQIPAGSFVLRPAILTAFSMQTAGQLAGIHLTNRTSRGARAGVRLELETLSSDAPAVTFELSRDLAVVNAPRGWCASISARRSF